MKFDCYGRFRLEIVREGERWTAYRLDNGTRVPDRDIRLPSELASGEIAALLDDLFHEHARPGQAVTRPDWARHCVRPASFCGNARVARRNGA